MLTHVHSSRSACSRIILSRIHAGAREGLRTRLGETQLAEARSCNCAMNRTLQVYEQTILTLLSKGSCYDDISEYLRGATGVTRGLSARSVRRFCSSRGARVRSLVDQPYLDLIVRSIVSSVGHSYGHRTIQGLLRSVGVRACQARVALSLRQAAPVQYASRCHNTNRLLNPLPYCAR